MKHVALIVALALVAGASFNTAEAAKKKKKEPVAQQPAVLPVQLTTGSDSLSYTAGMAATNGLIPFLLQQQVDTAMMADFIRGFQEATQVDDPHMNAYAVGMSIAMQVKSRMLPGLANEFQGSPDSIVQATYFRGFTDALAGDTSVFKQSDAEEFFKARQLADKAAKEEALYGRNRDLGRKFLLDNAKKEGVLTTPSGLQYKVLVQGEGEVPQRSDKVLVNYEGRLVDGTVFDASSRHGKDPSSFRADQVIPGWTEALTMMPVGSKWQLYIPYELAYGERNMGQIQPFSTLIFDVELVGIDRPKAAEEPAQPASKKPATKRKK